MFLLEGIPTVLLGFVVLRLFDRPARDATWLPAANRAWLEATMARERAAVESPSTQISVWGGCRSARMAPLFST